jgi:dTDP-4-dehydrorhamnose reductase
MKVLVTGSSGQLGQCLDLQVKKKSLTNFIFYSKLDLDLSNYKNVEKKIMDIMPNIVINAAGFTNVDSAENNEIDSNKINNLSVKNLARICKHINATLIHVSTDYVFDGNANKPYREEDKTSPKTVYGKTKLAGEEAIISSGCFYVIIRTSWVFSEFGNNFMKSMLDLFAKKESINIVDDQIGCPTFAHDIAIMILELTNHIKNGKLFRNIFHFSGDNKTSWFGFAKAIYKEKRKKNHCLECKLNPVNSYQYKTLAERPKFSVLDCSKIDNQLNIKPSDWNKAIVDVISSLNI